MKLLYNGKILSKSRFVDAVLIYDEMIIDIGSKEDLLNKYQIKDELLEEIDLKNRLVLPGFNDSHLHVISYAKSKLLVSVSNALSKSDLVEIGKNALIKSSKPLFLNAYNDELFQNESFLNRDDLDEISKDIPIVCYRVCGHKAIVNSKMIDKLALSYDTFVEGGEINLVTGVLAENALLLIDKLDDGLEIDELQKYIKETIKDANSFGITSISTNDVNSNTILGKLVVEAYKKLEAEEKLNARINLQFSSLNKQDILDFYKNDYNSSYFRIGPLKLFIDGSLGAKTAYLSKNYLGSNSKGLLTMTKEKLIDLLELSKSNGIQVVIHAIGDSGINFCLDAFEKVTSYDDLRNAIIHVQITDEATISRFKDSRINAIVQPIFISEDMLMLENRVESALAKTSYAFKSLSEATITAFSSDAPYGGFNVLEGIYASVTRRNLENTATMNLNEQVSVEEAVKMYTENPSFLSYEEKTKGKIEKGYFADLVVLEEDIFNISVEKIKDVKVAMTILGGKIVYDKR